MSSGELKSVLERIKEISRRISWRIPKSRERERERGYKLGKPSKLASTYIFHSHIPIRSLIRTLS